MAARKRSTASPFGPSPASRTAVSPPSMSCRSRSARAAGSGVGSSYSRLKSCSSRPITAASSASARRTRCVIDPPSRRGPFEMMDLPLIDRYLGFDFHREAERELGHADGGAGVLAGVRAPEVEDEVGEAVDHGRGPGEPGGGVDHAEDAEPAGDPVQVAEGALQAGEDGEGGQAGGVVGLLL